MEKTKCTIRKKRISMSIISISLTVRGQPSYPFHVKAWLPLNCEMDYWKIISINPRTSKGGGGGGVKWTPIGFLDLKFEAFKQSK